MEWFTGDISAALSSYKEKNGILIVYVFSNDDNSTKFTQLWDSFNLSVLDAIPYVAIRLEKESEGAKQFAQFFPTPIFPVCYILGLNAQPLEVVTSVEELSLERLNNSFVKAITLYKDQLNEQGIAIPKAEKGNANGNPAGEAGREERSVSPKSQAATSEMTQEEKLEYYRKRLAEKAKEDAKKKEEEEREKELSRRNEGKSLAEAKEKQRERELREMADERRRQKEADAQALKRIREQLKQDKEERAKRLNKGEGSGVSEEAPKQQPKEEESTMKPVNSEECRIQCRFPDGSSLNLAFPSKEPLKVVLDAVNQDSRKPPSFFLVQPYPRKKLTEFDKSLLELNLTPSSVILVVSGSERNSNVAQLGYLNMFIGFVYFPLTLLTSVYNYLAAFVGSGRTRGVGNNVPQTAATGRQNENEQKRKEKLESDRMQRDGNIGRFRNEDESDPSDNEAFWNGNSTQQL